MKMTVSKALELRAALQNCDGYHTLVGEGEGEQTACVLQVLGFNARFTIAKNLEKLDKVNEAYVKFRNDLIKTLSKNGMAIDPQEHETVASFHAKDQENLATEIEVEIEKLKKSELEKSNLPVNVLSTMIMIIQE